MPSHKYERPKNLVIEEYRGKELEEIFQFALEKTIAPSGVKVTRKAVKNFSNHLSQKLQGGNLVLIIEQYPLNSMEAHGRFGDLIYATIRKTGTQYTKKYKKPKNPQTPAQQIQREKYARAILAWQSLNEEEKNQWRRKNINPRWSGYNYFVSKYLRSH